MLVKIQPRTVDTEDGRNWTVRTRKLPARELFAACRRHIAGHPRCGTFTWLCHFLYASPRHYCRQYFDSGSRKAAENYVARADRFAVYPGHGAKRMPDSRGRRRLEHTFCNDCTNLFSDGMRYPLIRRRTSSLRSEFAAWQISCCITFRSGF